GRDPRLWQGPRGEELPEVAGIAAVRLCPVLGPAQGGGIGWFRHMSLDASLAELLDHEAPARAALDGKGSRASFHAGQPCPQVLAGGRCDPASMYLARMPVQVVGRDLRAVNVQTAYDAHLTSSRSLQQP